MTGIQVVSLFFAFLLGEMFIPPYTVRCFIARSARQARWGVASSGLFLLLFLPVVTLILGTAAQIDPGVTTAVEQEKNYILETATQRRTEMSEEDARREAVQIAFPTLVRTVFPPLFAGIMIAAIMAAVMSSADSCLSCLATVAMEDYYRRHLNRQAS